MKTNLPTNVRILIQFELTRLNEAVSIYDREGARAQRYFQAHHTMKVSFL